MTEKKKQKNMFGNVTRKLRMEVIESATTPDYIQAVKYFLRCIIFWCLMIRLLIVSSIK